MKLSIEHIGPNDESYESLEEIKKQSRRPSHTREYDQIATAYNDTEIGGYVSVGALPFTVSNLEKALLYRSLTRNEDYYVFKIKLTDKGAKIPTVSQPVVLKRISINLARVLS